MRIIEEFGKLSQPIHELDFGRYESLSGSSALALDNKILRLAVGS
jgi:hypothetical protein